MLPHDNGKKLDNTESGVYRLIISAQHVHLDHDNCLEIVVVRGKPQEVEKLARRLQTAKGVRCASLAAASTGRNL